MVIKIARNYGLWKQQELILIQGKTNERNQTEIVLMHNKLICRKLRNKWMSLINNNINKIKIVILI